MRHPVRPGRALAAALTAAILTAGSATAQSVPAPVLKAAFLFNFAQFVEWPAETVAAGAPLVFCVVNDPAVSDALDHTLEGRKIDGHGLIVKRLKAGAPFAACHVLYLAGGPDLQPTLDAIETVRGSFIFTVSDAPRFSRTGGMVELFREEGRMRFAVNIDALARARIRLSSRVLGLARIVRDADPQ